MGSHTRDALLEYPIKSIGRKMARDLPLMWRLRGRWGRRRSLPRHWRKSHWPKSGLASGQSLGQMANLGAGTRTAWPSGVMSAVPQSSRAPPHILVDVSPFVWKTASSSLPRGSIKAEPCSEETRSGTKVATGPSFKTSAPVLPPWTLPGRAMSTDVYLAMHLSSVMLSRLTRRPCCAALRPG